MSSDDESLRNSSYNSSPGRSIGGRRAIDQEPGAKGKESSKIRLPKSSEVVSKISFYWLYGRGL
jgi:hypothetical protein